MFKSTGLVFGEKPSIGVEPTSLVDRSRFGNNGTYTDITDVQLPSGLWERDFNGSSSVILTANDLFTEPVFKSGITLLFWFNADTLDDADQRLLSHEDRPVLYIEATTDKLDFFHWDGSAVDIKGNSAISTARWYLAGATWNPTGTLMTLYQDAVAQDDTDATQGAPVFDNVNRPVALGRAAATASGWFDGKIALPRIWNYALSAGQIKQIFESERHWFGV